jgi:hypothetical protein
MSRRTVRTPQQAESAAQWARDAMFRGLEGGKAVVVSVTRATRTLEQNAKVHAMIEEFSQQAEHRGQKFSADDWKILLVHGFGKEVRLLPALDGGLIGVPARTSHFTVSEGSDFIEYLNAKGVEYGVKFKAPERWE